MSWLASSRCRPCRLQSTGGNTSDRMPDARVFTFCKHISNVRQPGCACKPWAAFAHNCTRVVWRCARAVLLRVGKRGCIVHSRTCAGFHTCAQPQYARAAMTTQTCAIARSKTCVLGECARPPSCQRLWPFSEFLWHPSCLSCTPSRQPESSSVVHCYLRTACADKLDPVHIDHACL